MAAAQGGLMERAERMILLGVGFLAPVAPGSGAVGAARPHRVTAVGRFVRVWRAAEGPARPAPVGPGRAPDPSVAPGPGRIRAGGPGARAGHEYPAVRRPAARRAGRRWRARRQEAPASRTGRGGPALGTRACQRGVAVRSAAGPHGSRGIGLGRAGLTGRPLGLPRHRVVERPHVPGRTYLTYRTLGAGHGNAPRAGRGRRRRRGRGARWRGGAARPPDHARAPPAPGAGLESRRACRAGSRPSCAGGRGAPSAPTPATGSTAPGCPATAASEVCTPDAASSAASSTWTRRWPTGRGVVMALPHVGSWEWGGAWLAPSATP